MLMPDRFAYHEHKINFKVRVAHDDIEFRGCETDRMSRTRKTRRPIEELDVTIVPDDYEPPFHYLRQWREFKGLTLEQFAELVGTSKGNASDLENGKRELGMKWLWRISEALHIRPGFILEHDPNDQIGRAHV